LAFVDLPFIPTLAESAQGALNFDVEEGEEFDFASLSLERLERAVRIEERDPREAGRALLLSVCKEHGYSVADIADVLGCSKSQAGRIQRGERFLNVRGALRLHRVTGVSPIALLGLSEYEAKPP
jgi:plasmid maintenance system antidote protein VapI